MDIEKKLNEKFLFRCILCEMKDLMHSPCSECGGAVGYSTIAQEFEREGIRVSVAGIRALVCNECGEVYFEPGGTQVLVEAVDSLFAFAGQYRFKSIERMERKPMRKE